MSAVCSALSLLLGSNWNSTHHFLPPNRGLLPVTIRLLLAFPCTFVLGLLLGYVEGYYQGSVPPFPAQ
jgi:hypothetical protein